VRFLWKTGKRDSWFNFSVLCHHFLLGAYTHTDKLFLPGYEYRMCEKLYDITKKVVDGQNLSYPDKLKWRSLYCADMRTRELHGPENYMAIPDKLRKLSNGLSNLGAI